MVELLRLARREVQRAIQLAPSPHFATFLLRCKQIPQQIYGDENIVSIQKLKKLAARRQIALVSRERARF
jgi:hypothetical protein